MLRASETTTGRVRDLDCVEPREDLADDPAHRGVSGRPKGAQEGLDALGLGQPGVVGWMASREQLAPFGHRPPSVASAPQVALRISTRMSGADELCWL